MSPRTGRPILENAKRNSITIRLDADDAKKLDAICKAQKMSKSEAIRFAIREVDAKKGKR